MTGRGGGEVEPLRPERWRNRVDLHVHLEGSVPPRSLLSNAQRRGPTVTRELAETLACDGLFCRTRADFDRVWATIRRVLVTPEDYREALAGLMEDLHADGVAYAEIRVNAGSACLRRDIPPDELIDALSTEMRIGRRRGLTRCSLTLGVSREHGVRDAVFVTEMALRYLGRGVDGLDLCGPEPPDRVEMYREIAQRVGSGLLPITVHAGEWGGVEGIWDAISELRPRRLSHCVSMLSDGDLLCVVKESGICIEACLSSNLYTGAIRALADHPIKEWVHVGVPVVLCSDDRTVFCTTLSREFELAAEVFGLSELWLTEQSDVARRHAFAPLLADACRVIDSLVSGEKGDGTGGESSEGATQSSAFRVS